MNRSHTFTRTGNMRLVVSLTAIVALFTGAFTYNTFNVSANHPVFVEGNCNVPPAGSSSSPAPGLCGDYDGDGRIGTAEDTDGDRVFGTITGALTDSTTGANQNGSVTIVTSGTFAEVVTITGNITLQAAPGVEANIDAVLQGDSGSGARQNAPGIIVNAPANRYVVLRNLRSKNWTSGIQVNGSSRVSIENCKLEYNTNYGIEVTGSARVAISNSEVRATGFRLNPMTGDFPTVAQPNPGKGIEFDDTSTGFVSLTSISGSFAAGLSNQTGRSGAVNAVGTYSFDNNPNYEGPISFTNNTGGSGANQPPSVSITSPVNGAVLPAGSTQTIQATASDSDGTVTLVEFFSDGGKLGEDSTAPYTYTMSNVPSGTFTLTAVATDNTGARTTSTPVTVTIR